MTLVFVFNGNTFGAVGPSALTANAAGVLKKAGEKVVQMSNPTLSTPAAFNGVVRQIEKLSQGQPIGLVGFSAGGSLVARLSGVAELHVTAALDYYGEPDLIAYLNSHGNDRFGQYVAGHVHFTPAAIDLFSGPIPSNSAYVVAAFGSLDQNVVPSLNEATFHADDFRGAVYVYPGPHDAPITASPPALADFLEQLSAGG